MRGRTLPLIANAISFQLVWLITVAGAAAGRWWAGPLAVIVFAAWQLPLSPHRRADLKLMSIAALTGFAIDSVLVLAGLVTFRLPVPWESAAPIWIVSLWVAFALTLNHSMRPLKRSPMLAMLLGLLGAPLAYGIAARGWNAVDLNGSPTVVLVVIGLIWAVVTPTLLALTVNHPPALESS